MKRHLRKPAKMLAAILSRFHSGDIIRRTGFADTEYDIAIGNSDQSGIYVNTAPFDNTGLYGEGVYGGVDYVQYVDTPLALDHSVCIAGWDDNFSVSNFCPDHQPPGDGAWIVKNSWCRFPMEINEMHRHMPASAETRKAINHTYADYRGIQGKAYR